MSRQAPISPRKSPRQARAKFTVDAIVEATTQVLRADGYDRLTTARAAERAGVSVGTLYQYFPNKAALASAVIDRNCEQFLTAFEQAIAHHDTLADCIRALVDFAIDARHTPPDLHRIVNELVPRLGVAERTELVSRAAAQAVEAALRKHANEIAPEIDLAVAATIIETMLEAIAHRIVLARPSHDGHEALARETVRMITRYLTGGRDGAST
jgi:AcrR family transcriptional regulator